MGMVREGHAVMSDHPWTCDQCGAEQTHEQWCEACHKARFQSWDIMVSEHVLEHIADGLATPLEVQKAMNARPCYARIRGGFELRYIVQRIRMLTNDTSDLARKLLKAQAHVMALNVIHNGDTKDHVNTLKGIQVLGEVVEHKGETITRHVVELHEGPPPRKDG